MSTKRILTSYVGTVRGLQSHIAAQMYPGKVVSLDERRTQKKKPPQQRRSVEKCKIVKFGIPESIA